MSEHPLTLHANHFSREKQVRFLEALALWGSVRAACRAVPVAPQTVYRARRACGNFALGWDAAMLVARPHVEDVLSDRALNGVEEAVYYHGEEIARRRRYDSRLLLAHLARLDRAEENDDVMIVACDFDAALKRFGRGQPIDMTTVEDDEGGEDSLEPWMNEDLPFGERVQLYLDSVEGDEGGEGAADDANDDDGAEGVSAPEVSEADIALHAAHDDMDALEAVHSPRSENAWDKDGHAARLAAYRAEAEVSSQDRVTPVTLPAAGAGGPRYKTPACAGPATDASSPAIDRRDEDARAG